MPPNDADLDAALLNAHAVGDSAALITLYERAASLALTQGREQAADFYLTHAYVYALERGDARALTLHAQLVARGRDEPAKEQTL